MAFYIKKYIFLIVTHESTLSMSVTKERILQHEEERVISLKSWRRVSNQNQQQDHSFCSALKHMSVSYNEILWFNILEIAKSLFHKIY